MPDVKDMDLIQEYAARDSEPAFAELVHRHINLVYSVALRYLNNSQDAQDVTQAVFIILAKKAAGLYQRTTITGWLYETTRFTAARFLRTRARQQAREQEAYVQSTLNDSDTDSVWRQLAPLLEEAMTRLNEKERALLALRFFENKSSAEAASLLGIQDWAARKRASRALEKLQQFFLKRGIVSTTGAIVGAISANSVQAAPVALAKSVTALAVAKGATASGSTLTLIKGALKIMAWSKAKTSIITYMAVLLFAAGTSAIAIKEIKKHRQASRPKPQTQIIRIAPNGSIGVFTLKKSGQSSQSNGNAVRSYGHATPGLGFHFKIGSSRDVILSQLKQIHATILTNSPDLLRAEPEKTAKMTAKPMQMEFSFIDEKLARINFILPMPDAPQISLTQPQQ